MAAENTLSFDLPPEKVVDVDFFSEEVHQNWRDYAREWAGGPSFYSVSNGMPVLVLANYADNVEVLRGSQTGRFTTEPPKGMVPLDLIPGAPTITLTEGDTHRRLRSALQPAFAAQGVGIHGDFIEATVKEFLDEVEANGPEFDAMADLTRKIISRILLGGMLGNAPEHVEVFTAMSNSFGEIAANQGHTPRTQRVFDAAAAISEEMLDNEEYRNRDDFIGRLVKACHDGLVNRGEFVGGVITICAGGLSSTASATAMMLREVCRRPAEFDEVRRDPTLVPAAVNESLRHNGVGLAIFPRYCMEPTELGDVTAYPGIAIQPSPPLANYDPAQFEDPFAFDIHRKGKSLVFGTGPHSCIGLLFARKVMQVTLRQVLERFPDLRLIDPDFRPTYQGIPGELQPREVPMSLV